MEVNENDIEPLRVNDPNAPKSRARTPRTTAAPKPSKPEITESWAKIQATEIITDINDALKAFPLTEKDALNDKEQALLIEAVTEEAVHTKQIGNLLKKTENITPHFLLIRAIVQISIPRLMAHGVLPKKELTIDDIPNHSAAQCDYTCPLHIRGTSIDQIPPHNPEKCNSECLLHLMGGG